MFEVPVKYLYAVLGWVLWCTLHSALISIKVTEYTKKRLGDRFRFYRLFYNALSLGTLVPLLYYSSSIRTVPVFQWKGLLLIFKYVLLATSIYLFISAGRRYSISQFLGIRQIKTGRVNQALSEGNDIDTSGIMGLIRHPWYLAGIMIVWAGDLSLSTVVINIVISTYFIIGAFLEERKLVLEFGDQYRKYQKDVSMLVPYKWLKARIAGMHSLQRN